MSQPRPAALVPNVAGVLAPRLSNPLKSLFIVIVAEVADIRYAAMVMS